MASEAPKVPPPTKEEIRRRTAEAEARIKARGLGPKANAFLTELKVASVIDALRKKGVLTDEELQDAFDMTRMETYERLALESTPPVILTPPKRKF